MSLFNCNAANSDLSVRVPAVAGQFYTSDPSTLRGEVKKYLSGKLSINKHPKIIISPHAGYVFSGPVAGIGFKTIDTENIKKVILIGPSHHKYFTGVSIPEFDTYKTPLGQVALEKKDIKKLRSNKNVHAYPDAHNNEHCLEVELPFLQVLLSDFSIIPIITGKIDNHKDIADMIYPLIDNKTLVVISSDFSHFKSHSQAKNIDARSIETILADNTSGFLDACGESPIRIGMHLSKKLKLKPKLLDARNSYETAPHYGDSDRVVGYASIVYIGDGNGDSEKKDKLSKSDKKFMLDLAREALNRAVKGEQPPKPDNIPDIAKDICGCFVTLTKHGNLRGCIGYIEGIKPLYQAIIDNAKNASSGDPRFPNVTPDELDKIKVEVSVLTKPTPFDYSDTKDLLNKIEKGVDGIILSKGSRQSTFLPQVWDQLPDKIMFLQHLSMKAGLDKDGWKKASYKKYRAIHFEEK